MTAYMDHKDLANEVIEQSRAREITDGVHRVLDRIAEAESVAGREAGSVHLLAATKTRDVGRFWLQSTLVFIESAKTGRRRLSSKRRDWPGCWPNVGIHWAWLRPRGAAADAAHHIPFHLIGQLQANKISKVLPVVDTIESVDSIELAEKIARRATMRGITVGVLLEVNESGEESKSGCAPSHAIDLAQRIGAMGGLRLQGLMTIGAHVDDERTIRAGFAHLRRTRDQILPPVPKARPTAPNCPWA